MFEGPFGTVGGAENAFFGAFFAVFLFQQFTEHTESNSRFCGGAGFADHVDRNIFAFAQGNQFCQRTGADAVTAVVNGGRIFCQVVIPVGLQKFDSRPSAQVRTANADHHKHIGIAADFFRGLLNAGKFFFIVIDRQIHPTQEIIALAVAAVKRFMGRFYLRGDCIVFFFADKCIEIASFIFQCHTLASSVVE